MSTRVQVLFEVTGNSLGELQQAARDTLAKVAPGIALTTVDLVVTPGQMAQDGTTLVWEAQVSAQVTL